ncbi:MAG: hypothetical protein JW969_11510 [Spirochaetales bacterium]|nr:hypothetical protein [Spirochaetales bacterium]
MQTATKSTTEKININDLSLEIYRYPKRKFGLNEDDCGDFFLHFYPKLKKALNRFEYQGKPFQHYLNKSIYWEFYHYLRKKKKKNFLQVLARSKDLWVNAEYPVPGYEKPIPAENKLHRFFKLDANGRIRSAAGKKQFLFHSLRHAWFLNERHYPVISARTGMDTEWIANAVTALRPCLHNHAVRHNYLVERKNRLFFKIRFWEHQLACMTPNRDRQGIVEKIIAYRKSFTRTIRALSRVKLTVSNRNIAQVTGYPKGTVASSLVSINKKLNQFTKNR